MAIMQLVEQHIIDKADSRWEVLDVACFLSKNLYNAANYVVRQAYIFEQRYVGYDDLVKAMKHNPDYCAIPRKVSQWVLKQVDHDWQAFFAARAVYEEQPDKFTGKPRLPKYKHKMAGRNLLTYTDQAVSRRQFKKRGLIKPSGLNMMVQTQQASFDQVRIVPRKTHYVVEVVYTVKIEPDVLDSQRVAAIDIGLDALATVAFNQPEFAPLLVNGRPLKSLNRAYNKARACLQSQLPEDQHTSRRLERITDKRNRQVNAYLHLASRRIIDLLRLFNFGTLIVGKNDGWKQDLNLGKRTNQNFVQIPHARFIDLLAYKANLAGIKFILTEESYTSKCSLLDLEPIGKQAVYAGKRVKRWLFRAGDGRELHADVNAAFNIMRKVIPDALDARGIAAAVVQPMRVTPA